MALYARSQLTRPGVKYKDQRYARREQRVYLVQCQPRPSRLRLPAMLRRATPVAPRPRLILKAEPAQQTFVNHWADENPSYLEMDRIRMLRRFDLHDTVGMPAYERAQPVDFFAFVRPQSLYLAESPTDAPRTATSRAVHASC